MTQTREAASVLAAAVLVALVWPGTLEAQTQNTRRTTGVGAQLGGGPMTYRVNYRPGENDPWQLYAETRDLAKANKIADEVKESGYQAQVVDDLTPSAQPFPDAAETSASAYYPGSNWSADYNYYVVPGGRYNNYGWYGGWNPWYGYRLYPNYWWNGGRSWYSAGWPGHYWGHGWHRGAGWGAGWSGSHRYWNYSHPDRGTH
jgi:hypothetical protein